ncbi:ABC transporter permease [Nocardioides pocheonensis]|uniref:ABC transporter permease subunit n=1 Tax=Nocardioides pocheonensis TaxID=661485 RepID=A0A3N0GXM7_9ACTN|nr:ABC transporter permease subunit [Nocardioides pocheonensis]RNM16956.1 ABC transporter permease subunit [Nocardioides pocheonensis]
MTAPSAWARFAVRALLGTGGVLAVAGLWEAYKALGPDTGVVVHGVVVLPRTTDMAMPHVWDMLHKFSQPVNIFSGHQTVGSAVLDACVFSLKLAATGWLIGVVVGFALAVLMARFRLAESAMLPWIVLSQTVPLIAIAPLVRRWGSQIHIGGWTWTSENSVAVIAAYLAFFPVAVGALRGLRSPDATHLDLMHAYGVGWWRGLVKLRLPASVPYLLPALRLAAASAVIGTVVAEVSIGLRGGVGRMIIEYAQSAGGDPAKPWAPIFGAIGVGLVAAGAVGLIGLLLRPYRRGEAS